MAAKQAQGEQQVQGGGRTAAGEDLQGEGVAVGQGPDLVEEQGRLGALGLCGCGPRRQVDGPQHFPEQTALHAAHLN